MTVNRVIINTVKYQRHSIRLKNFDYSNTGYYFVTICSHEKEEIFGKIVGARRDAPQMKLNNNGKIIKNIWLSLPNYHFVILDEFCIMPNHIHLILVIRNKKQIKCRGVIDHAQNESKMKNEGLINQTPTLGQIIRFFKAKSTCEINKINQTPGLKIFQRNYFERIIRNQKELDKIREYIRLNPIMWSRDRNNLSNRMLF